MPSLEVEEHVQEVGGLHVGLDLEAQAVPPEDLPHLLADLLHLSGTEGADTEEVVSVQASVDGKMGQLRQQKQANGVASLGAVEAAHRHIEQGVALLHPDLFAVPQEGLLSVDEKVLLLLADVDQGASPRDRLVEQLLGDRGIEAVDVRLDELEPGLVLQGVEPLQALHVGLPLSQASDPLQLLVDPGEDLFGRPAEFAFAGVEEAALGVVHEPLFMIFYSDHGLPLLQLEDAVMDLELGGELFCLFVDIGLDVFAALFCTPCGSLFA